MSAPSIFVAIQTTGQAFVAFTQRKSMPLPLALLPKPHASVPLLAMLALVAVGACGGAKNGSSPIDAATDHAKGTGGTTLGSGGASAAGGGAAASGGSVGSGGVAGGTGGSAAGSGGSASGGTGTGGRVGSGGLAGGSGGTGVAGSGGAGGAAGSAGRGGAGGSAGAGGRNGAGGSAGAAGRGGAGGSEEPGVTYCGYSYFGNLDHAYIQKRDTTRAMCFLVQLSAPGTVSVPDLSLPQGWGGQRAQAGAFVNGQCSLSVFDRSITGTIAWIPPAQSIPLAADIDIVLTFPASDAGVPITERVQARGLSMRGTCPP